ncbi:MAG TPA: MazG nucleotide pyrophosphohydrolase domain-containing protein, partial [Thermodesulfovibrio thiophilus]|nr:MazG nucleotide pyrophosphohydrolase domain-containing protein [Thermodesulfovibrio thiophilus]
MNANEYQKAALRTASKNESYELILNGVLGLSGETGEVADHIKKYLFQGHDLNKHHLAEELG